MVERLIENWLTKVNEKSFQVPFCQMLIGEGYKVIHLSRHGSFEEGKDVLAISPEGTPCAFQLKGSDSGKITQKEWGKYHDQIVRLIETPINHPSIDKLKKREVFFVTNGELEEEVRVEITNQNSDRKSRSLPELQTIVKGELINRFIKIHTNLWPLQLESEKELLELYLSDGTGYLNKAKFAGFIEDLLMKNIGRKEIIGQRILASASIFASYALLPFALVGNHVALIEGWTIYLSCLIAYVEKNRLNKKHWLNSAKIAEDEIEFILSELCKELKSIKHFVAGNPLVDAPFYRGRLTWLLGYVSSYFLLKKQQNSEIIDEVWFSEFIFSNQSSLLLWGEAATPQLLAVYWALKALKYNNLADRLLFAMFKGVLEKTTHEGIPDPYHNLGEIVLSASGLTDNILNEHFAGRTYSLESFLQLLTKQEYRGILEENWKIITHLQFVNFEPEKTWQFCKWSCENGTFHEVVPKSPQSWQELVDTTKIINIKRIPTYFQKKTALLLILLIVYPHRLFPDAVKHLDNSFST